MTEVLIATGVGAVFTEVQAAVVEGECRPAGRVPVGGVNPG